MRKILLLSVLMLMIATNMAAQNEKLYGTWKLLSAVTTVIATGEKYDSYGKDPHGFITYGPEGRMQVVITSGPRARPSATDISKMTDKEGKELLGTMTAYAGTYAFDGKTVTHHIDVSWNELWTGTSQVRDVSLNAGRATYTTRPATNPRDGKMSTTTLVWEKVK